MTSSAPIERTSSNLGGAAHPGDLGAERLGQLHRERSHTARRPDDQDFLPRLDLALVAKRLEGGEAGDGDGRGLLEAEVGRFGREVVLWSAGVLGVGAVAPAEDLIARLGTGSRCCRLLQCSRRRPCLERGLWVCARP